MSTPPSDPGDGPGTPFDPFRYGRPDADSPAAAAFPDLFPPVAPAPSIGPGQPNQPNQYPHRPQYQNGQYQNPQYSPPYGYPPPAPQPVPHTAHSAVPAAGNGKAVAGLVLGCVSLVLCFLTVLDVPLIIAGVVFSILGLRAARVGRGQRRLAVAGLVLSIVAGFAVVAIGVVLVRRAQHCEQSHVRGSASFNQCLIDFTQ